MSVYKHDVSWDGLMSGGLTLWGDIVQNASLLSFSRLSPSVVMQLVFHVAAY